MNFSSHQPQTVLAPNFQIRFSVGPRQAIAGELRRGVEMIRHRGDEKQAGQLEGWLDNLLNTYENNVLNFTQTEAQVWGKLRAPHHENAIDKQIAATALTYGLTLVTRNTSDFMNTGVSLLNPFH